MNNYEEIIAYLFSRLPMYQRIGAAAYKADLKNTLALCQLLGNPEKFLQTIHVGGTNGKGSTSHMLASVFQECGYKTGLFTSPHLKDFRERIRINGQMIEKEWIVDFVHQWKNNFEKIGLSFFEMTVGMAFEYFREQQVDIAVIEVGMGGRLDSTNVITPMISVITNISRDHMKFLGNTLAEIAFEKAGIIKPGVPVVIGETHPDSAPVFISKAAEMQAPITFADQLWNVTEENDEILIAFENQPWMILKDFPLKGSYQHRNLRTVCEALRVFVQTQPGFIIPEEKILKGLRNVVKNTGLQGRWQVLNHSPLTICDVGHNEDGIRQVLLNLRKQKFRHLHFVFGMVNDKDTETMLSLLPTDATYYFCKPDIPRGLPVDELAEAARRFQLKGSTYPSVAAAYQAACQAAAPEDLIMIGGSTFVVAEVL